MGRRLSNPGLPERHSVEDPRRPSWSMAHAAVIKGGGGFQPIESLPGRSEQCVNASGAIGTPTARLPAVGPPRSHTPSLRIR